MGLKAVSESCLLRVPRGDHNHVRKLGAKRTPNRDEFVIDGVQMRSGLFRNWIEGYFADVLLDVAFDQRDEARSHGCHWDPNRKSWIFSTRRPWAERPEFVKKHSDFNAPRRWIMIPYELKEEAKRSGFSWDLWTRSWYIRAERFDINRLDPKLLPFVR